MDSLLSAAHLRRELGEELFNALVSSDNTGKVKAFCDTLVKSGGGLPTEMTIEGRTFEILGFLREGETSAPGHTMVARAKEMNAHLGEEDGRWFLDHQDQIPASLRGKVIFVFTDWRSPGVPGTVYYVYWGADSRRWVRDWSRLVHQWRDYARLPRRK